MISTATPSMRCSERLRLSLSLGSLDPSTHRPLNMRISLIAFILLAAVCTGHAAPFDYLIRAYFEPASDQVVHAPRGGGKTRLAAVATLLDLLHKPGLSVRILGGSLEQSLRLRDRPAPQGNGPTRVSRSSMSPASASQTSSSSVMAVPRETTVRAWPASASAVAEQAEWVSQTLNAEQPSSAAQ